MGATGRIKAEEDDAQGDGRPRAAFLFSSSGNSLAKDSIWPRSTSTGRLCSQDFRSSRRLAIASATGCTPTRFGWRWTTPDADLGDGGPFVGALGEPATVFRGWTEEGSHTIEVRNTGCPGAVPGRATIAVGPRDAPDHCDVYSIKSGFAPLKLSRLTGVPALKNREECCADDESGEGRCFLHRF